ncbi:MAG: hypothetical protein R3D59_08930 [Paracoccaceae bacterium]
MATVPSSEAGARWIASSGRSGGGGVSRANCSADSAQITMAATSAAQKITVA